MEVQASPWSTCVSLSLPICRHVCLSCHLLVFPVSLKEKGGAALVPLSHLSLSLSLSHANFIPLSRSLTLPTTNAFSCMMWPCRIPVRPQPKWRPAVRKTLGHASMPLSLAVHWELIGVTTPQQLQPKIDCGLSRLARFEEVSNTASQER